MIRSGGRVAARRAAIAGARRAAVAGRGQTLVEFALVIPLFLFITLAIVEFAFVFNAVLATNFATRAAALLAVEGGNGAGTDCVILRGIEREVGAPADRPRILSVGIYRSDVNGVQLGGAVNQYARTGSTTCTLASGDTVTVPYSMVGTAGYPESDRCNVLLGCPAGPSGSHAGLDTVGVRLEYSHTWRTPLDNFLPGSGSGYVFERSNAMRMEPVL
jgi:Flp pilus assembly protein TadG